MNILGRDSSIYRYLGFEDLNDQGVVVQLVDHVSGSLSQAKAVKTYLLTYLTMSDVCSQ